jgi:AcrR family transcriptional regulator
MTTALDDDVAKAQRKSSSSGEETKARILAATLETLAAEGIAGTSARAIARAGDFNQALIFYHFGSVDDAIVAAVGTMNARRIENHAAKLEAATSLTELIHVARALHHDDTATDNMAVLTQALAGAGGHPEMGTKLYQQLEPWSQMVSATIDRILAGLPGAGTVPTEQIANAISAMFLGIELLDDLDSSTDHAGQLFDSLESLAQLLEDLLATPLLEMLLPNRE